MSSYRGRGRNILPGPGGMFSDRHRVPVPIWHASARVPLCEQGKNQAFLEMEELSSAVAMVNYFTNCAAQLRDRSGRTQPQ
jgi:hypothetical protein